MPRKQDPRVTEESLEYIEMFFGYVASNNNEDLTDLLECLPDLVYAIDEERGSAAMNYLVFSGKAEDLATARILMRYNPDLTIRDKDGWDAIDALQAIKDPHLIEDFARLLIPNIQFEDYAVVEARAIAEVQAEAAAREAEAQASRAKVAAETDAVLARADAYFARPDVAASERVLREIESSGTSQKGGSSSKGLFARVFNFNLQEITYDQDLAEIFKNLSPLNMDEQKKLNQMSFEVNSLLKGISFAPVSFESPGHDPLSIVIIPKEVIEFGYEQFSNLLGQVYDYLSGAGQE